MMASMDAVSVAGPAVDSESVVIQQRLPKRVLHFSDGILEEFSDEEDAADSAAVVEQLVDEVQTSYA